MIIFGLWLISILFSAPLMYYTTYFKEENNTTGTVVEYCFNDRSSMFPKWYVASFTAVFIFAPTVILSGVYLIIIKKLKQLNECYFYQKSTSTTSSGGKATGASGMEGNEMAAVGEAAQPEYFTSSATSSNSYSMKVKYTPAPNNVPGSGSGNVVCANNSLQTTSLIQNKKSLTAGTTIAGGKGPKKTISVQYRMKKERGRAARNKMSSALATAPSNTEVNKATVNINKSSYGKNLIAKRNQTITICLISLAFFFCQIPIKIFQIFNSFYEFKSESESTDEDLIRFKIMNIIFLSTKLLFYLHGCSNPIM
jgi:hypothetical protein